MGRWVDATTAASAAGLADALRRLWAARLERVPDAWLSTTGRQALVALAPALTAESPVAGGFEWIARAIGTPAGGSAGASGAASGGADPDTFWSLDLGGLAWMARLTQLRTDGRLPETPGAARAAAIEQAWAAEGATGIAARLDAATRGDPTTDATIALYRLPLAVWSERNQALAVRLLDVLGRVLPSATVQALGATWPLTYAAVHALRGHPEAAAHLLDERRSAVLPRDWQGLATVEVRYARARYLWEAERTADAVRLITGVLRESPSHVLRLLTDPVWQGANLLDRSALDAPLTRLATEALTAWTRWQQGPGATASDPRARRAQEMVRRLGTQYYPVLAASVTVGGVPREAPLRFDPAFHDTLERVRHFVAGLPATLHVRLGGPEDAPMAWGSEDSDLGRLEQAVVQGRVPEAVRRLDRLVGALPGELRLHLVHHGSRMVTALLAAGQITEAQPASPGNRDRIDQILRLLAEASAQVAPIDALGSSVGPELTRQVTPIWQTFQQIENAWVQADLRAYGRLSLVDASAEAPGAESLLRVPAGTGEWVAAKVRVTDGRGAPVGGVPLRWGVSSGPARPTDLAPTLIEDWSVSLQTGLAYLRVSPGAGVPGERGTVSVRLLSGGADLQLPYVIV